ncbi:protein translocase subunit SecD [Cohnella luojiensis]|uniref:Protein translocase subunit SecD n=1 Tax=Cohnella luojiensis TaxID=652876 RepID=A0A4Y8M6K6_9BACL|nr:protein translocase subunit SecD [Cohnella luojiensis]TFE30728.1 protein translocase subunit SecD [Cohnella luojiensis]
MKRIVAFVLVVLVSFGIMGAFTPGLLNGTKLGLDLKGGVEILYEAFPLTEGGVVTKEALIQTAKSLEKRANKTNVAEPEVTTEGKNRIRLKIAVSTGSTDKERDDAVEKIRDLMKRPAELQFRSAEGCADGSYCKLELLGSDFKEGAAKVEFDNLSRPLVRIEVNDKKKLADVSTKLVNKNLAIYLDEDLISDPVVQQPLTDGTAVISGQENREEAQNLADIINLGALPLKLTEKYTQSVGATLGKQSLNDTLFAGVLASVLILIFMLVLYRLPGLVASICLLVFVWVLLGVFYLMGATLTLPGIAAFVLGIGIAVDSNIITAERIKDELRTGKTITSSLRAGAKNSFRTIIDAHITTLIAGSVLYFMGHGIVKSFAVVLIASILVNILTNVFLPRYFLNLLVKSGYFNKPSYYSVKEGEIDAL